MRRFFLLAALALAPPAPALELESIELPFGTFPLQVVSAGPGRVLVVDKHATVLEVVGTTVSAEPWLTIPGVRSQYSESGLLSIALHPDFAETGAPGRGFLWAYFTRGSTLDVEDVLVRYRVPEGASRPDLATAVEVLAIPRQGDCHHGGQLLFGPPEGATLERFLYLTVGDGCSADGAEREPSSPDGKILRLRPSLAEPADPPWTAPADNPWAHLPGLGSSTWAMGLRNPWRGSFAPDGALWMGDVGDQEREELNRIPPGASGADLGWPVLEGSRCRQEPGCTPFGLLPVLEYGHDFDCSVIGGVMPTGGAVPWLAGQHVFADYCGKRVSALTEIAPGQWSARRLVGVPEGSPTSLGLDAEGDVWITVYWFDVGPGQQRAWLHRLVGEPDPLAVVTTTVPVDREAFPVQLVASGGTSGPAWSAEGLPPGASVSPTGLVDFTQAPPFAPRLATFHARSGAETASVSSCLADPTFQHVRHHVGTGTGAIGSPARTFRIAADGVDPFYANVRIRMAPGVVGCFEIGLVAPPPQRPADVPRVLGQVELTAAQPEAVLSSHLPSRVGMHGEWSLSLGRCDGSGVPDGLLEYEVEILGWSHGCHDSDGDGVVSTLDTCVAVADPTQADADADGLADACEAEWGDVAPPFGSVDIGDVVWALRASVGLVTPTLPQLQIADVEPLWFSPDDGLARPATEDVPSLDIADVVALLQASVGLLRFGPLE